MEKLYKQFYNKINYLIQKAPHHLKEDLFQELMIKPFELNKKIEMQKVPLNNKENYLFKSLKNYRAKFLEKNHKEDISLNELNQKDKEWIEFMPEECENKAQRQQINELFDIAHKILTEHEYKYFLLYYRTGWKKQEIANQYKVSIQSVSQNIKKINCKIKQNIK